MPRIQFKRGLAAQLPAAAAEGEPLWAEDSQELYVGNGPGQAPTLVTGSGGGTVTHTGALTANEPVLGNAGGDIKVGTKSGNTNELATVSGAVTNTHLAVWDASGNLVDGGAPAGGGTVTNTGTLTADDPVFGNGGVDVKVGTKSGNTNELATVSGALVSGNLIESDASGNLIDSGVPVSGLGTGNVSTAVTLTADLPVFGDGTENIKVGTKSGNTDEVATVSGALTSGHLLAADASGNVVDGGAKPSRGFGGVFNGGGAALSSGLTAYSQVPKGGTIASWTILVDTGTCTIKVWKKANGTAIPTVSDSINTSGVAIATGTALHSTTVTDFTTLAVSDEDIIGVHLEAVSGATQVYFHVEMT